MPGEKYIVKSFEGEAELTVGINAGVEGYTVEHVLPLPSNSSLTIYTVIFKKIPTLRWDGK